MLLLISILFSFQAQAGEWAELDFLGNVKRVIIADEAFIKTMPGIWVDVEKQKNRAVRRGKYDQQKRVFIPPRTSGYESWEFDRDTAQWKPPVPPPAFAADEDIAWNEPSKEWVKFKKIPRPTKPAKAPAVRARRQR